MSLMKRRTDNMVLTNHKQANRSKLFNWMVIMIFIFQLILPVGLNVYAVAESEEVDEPVTVEVQETKESEDVTEAAGVEKSEKKEDAKKSEENIKDEAEVEDTEDATDEADSEKEVEKDKKPEEEKEKSEAEKEKNSTEVEEKKEKEEKEVTDESEESAESSEDVEEAKEGEEESKLAEDFPAIATPMIPIPMMKSMRSSGGSELEDTIEVEKTAERILGLCRIYEINLNITGVPQEAPVDVVLVIDRSGSMNERVGGWGSDTRLYYAKQAAINFAGRVLGPNGIPGSRVSVVSFSGPQYANAGWNDPYRHYGYQNQASTDLDLSSNLSTVTNTINGITAVGGTNTEAGFKEGQSVIQGATSDQNPNSNKVVVMLTDGLPTVSNGNPYQETTNINHVHIQSAIDAGQNIYQNDIADVFTIGLTTGMNSTEKNLADNILTQAQNKGYYPAPTAQDLDAIFTSISQSLGYAAKDVKVVDKIGDNFELVPGSLPSGATYDPNTREITWEPGTIVDEANLTYQVAAKSNFPGGLADTNEYAKLTYTDVFGNENQEKDFPVPEVDVPTLLEVSLTDVNINLGDSISLGSGTDPSGENYMSPVTGGDNDGETFTYEWRKVGDSTIISTDKNPSVSPTEDTEYELTVIDSNGCIAIAKMFVRVNKNIGKISISKMIKDYDQIMEMAFFGDVDPSIFTNEEFEIKVSGPNNYEQMITLKHGETEVLDELVLGQYTIEEINIDTQFMLENIDPTSFELTNENIFVEVDVLNKVNFATFEFIKVNEEGNPLADIEFELSKDGVTQTVTTDADGEVFFNFLEPGEYELKETKTLAGYKLPTETWIIQVVVNEQTGELEIIIPDDSFLTSDGENVIENEEQSEFPQTGGIGSFSYIAAGLTILSTSLGMFIKKENKH